MSYRQEIVGGYFLLARPVETTAPQLQDFLILGFTHCVSLRHLFCVHYNGDYTDNIIF